MEGDVFAILATGPSLTIAQADAVRGLRVIAVSDAYKLAPWAEVLASADAAWWRHHKPDFDGRRFSVMNVDGCERLVGKHAGINSGVFAIRVARHLGARKIILFGFDGHGQHFFGAHAAPLVNTTEARRKIHALQHQYEYEACRDAGVIVVNCSPGTQLTSYPTSTRDDQC